MKYSIVVPFYNEEDNIRTVLEEIRKTNPDAQIIAVNDGSTDHTRENLDETRDSLNIDVIHMPKNMGQSAALYYGLLSSEHEACAMMDGDGQNDPADIPALIEKLSEADVVCGYRRKRNDNWQRRIASRAANAIRSSLLGDGIRDTGCSLKVIRREHIRFLIPFNGLHRFIPALVKSAGLSIVEVPVNHRPRQTGVSKYTVAGRAIRGLYDLIGVSWLMSRRIPWPTDLPKL